MLRVERGSGYGDRLVTTEPFAAGQVIGRLAGYRVTRRPSYRSIQVGPDTHVEDLGVFSYLNHSCAPNTIVNTETLTITAARDIAPGEELTFFYPSTEWEMARPFSCLCGAPNCLGTVSGAKALSPQTLARYAVNRHIREMAARAGQDAPAAHDLPACGGPR